MGLWVFTIQATVVTVGVILVSWFFARRLGVGALVWFVGAVSFIASQVLRLPLITGLEAAGISVVLVTTFAVFSSGLFEEGARYIAFRWGLKKRRRPEDGVVFGLGHGGAEAILLIGLAAVNAIVLLTIGDQLLEDLAGVSPDAVAETEAAIQEVEAASAGDAALAVYERVLAIISHVAMTMMVLRAVVRRQIIWLGAAMGYHMFINAVAVTLMMTYGVFAAEAGLTFVTILSVYIIYTAWTNRSEWFGASSASGSASHDDVSPQE